MPSRTLAVLVLLAACSTGQSTSHPAADAATTDAQVAAGLAVSVTLSPPRLQVRDGKAVLLDGLTGGDGLHAAIAMRNVPTTYDMKFGSFRITEDTALPWQVATALDGTPTSFQVTGSTGVIGVGSVKQEGEGQVSITLEANDPAVNRVSMAFACQPGEHFLGLGGQSFDVDHRGNTVPLWVQEDGIGKVAHNDDEPDWFLVGRKHNTHTPMPIYLSSLNYAVVLETSHRAVFALCSESQDTVRIENQHGDFKLRVFRGTDVVDTLRLLTAYLGRPPLPPAFTFAPWIDAMFGSQNVRRVAHKLRQMHIPTSVVWTEDWRGGTSTGDDYTLDEDWNVDTKLYPDFAALADELHGLGFKFLTYENTFLTSDADIYGEALAQGVAITKADGTPYTFMGGKFVPATLLDISTAKGRDWAKAIWKKALELGADGWMGDFCEWLPTDIVLASGQTGLDAHQRYAVDCAQLNHDTLASMKDNVERLVFMRAGWLGSQPLVQVMWAGDQQTDWSLGDGLPSVIPIMLGQGVTGFPYAAHDIGGYQSANAPFTSKELWFRWCSFGALSPVMRTHHGRSANANWNWESDLETTAHFQRYATLHMRLFPYLYGMAKVAVATGLPMVRPLALRWPTFEAGWTATDQYLLGDRIVVAPVQVQGATSRQVLLPPGTFYPLLGGPAVQGTVTVAAPMGEIPAFVPAGTVLALLPGDSTAFAGVDTAVAATVTEVTTLASVGDDRELWLWPNGSSELTEAAGLRYQWHADGWKGPPVSATWNGQAVVVADGSVTVKGTGLLAVDGGKATLSVTGGASGRVLVVRWR